MSKIKIDFVHLPVPDDTLDFFAAIKTESEKYWLKTSPNKDVYGYQIQNTTKWRPGLSDHEIEIFEKTIGFKFPLPLRNFYKTMNGTTIPGVDVHHSGPKEYASMFYSFPDDLLIIQAKINWMLHDASVDDVYLEQNNISKIFPVFSHRFMLLDVPNNPILSMWRGDDIIYWCDNLSKLLAIEIFDNIYNASEFESDRIIIREQIKFWLNQ